MALSSINIQPAKSNSESHNERKCELDYVKPEHSYKNESWKEDSISNRREFIEHRCKEMTGRKLQKNATPIREGVLLFEKHHTMEHMKLVADEIQHRFGIKTFQIHMHKDEGHYNEKGKWNENLHAHFVFDWSDNKTGKMLRLGKADMSEMQTVVANVLGMDRGVSSDRKHLSALNWKIQAQRKQEKEISESIDIAYIQRDIIRNQIIEEQEKLAILKKEKTFKSIEERIAFLQNKQKELKPYHRYRNEIVKSNNKSLNELTNKSKKDSGISR